MKQIKYVCDECEKEMEKPKITSTYKDWEFSRFCGELDFCSLECYKKSIINIAKNYETNKRTN